MISLTPSLDLSQAGPAAQAAPPAAPARKSMGKSAVAGSSGPSRRARPDANTAPMTSWPSHPMFHRFMRAARITASPVRVRAEALTSTSENLAQVPNAP